MLLDLWNDILECNDEEMLKAAAEYFPVETSLSYFPLTASNVYVLCSVLKRVDKHVRQLNLRECKLDSHALNNICKAINEMPGKVILTANSLSSYSINLRPAYVKYDVTIPD